MLGIHSTPVCCRRHCQGERCYLRAEFSRTGYSELGVLVRVVVEEALGVYQAEEHLWQVVLKCDGSLLSCCAVRSDPFSVCLTARSHVLMKQLYPDPVGPNTPILSWVTSSIFSPIKFPSLVLSPNL